MADRTGTLIIKEAWTMDAAIERIPHEVEYAVQPYSPSLVDRLTDWIGGLPFPAWMFYAGVCIMLFFALNALRWLEGVDAPGVFNETPALWGLYLVYYLAMIHYLDGVAERALKHFRPALRCSDE